MTPQTVNAVNLPLQNALSFPAAILEPPFFDASAPDAFNYGAIGAVIGHEVSHTFDTEGAGPIGFAPRVQILVLRQNAVIVQVNGRLPDNAASLFVGHHGQAERRNDGIGAPDTPELQDHSEALRSGEYGDEPRIVHFFFHVRHKRRVDFNSVQHGIGPHAPQQVNRDRPCSYPQFDQDSRLSEIDRTQERRREEPGTRKYRRCR